MRSRILTLISAILLVSAGLLWAQTSATSPSPQQPATGHGHMTGGSMMGGHGEGGSMMEGCKAMMEKRQAMMDQMKAMDARLDALVQAMNAAQGSEKIDATAAVATELVAQRTAMREHMQSMQSMMMQHMMTHMEGMKGMKGMKESMERCPMMQEEKSEEGDHEKHH